MSVADSLNKRISVISWGNGDLLPVASGIFNARDRLILVAEPAINALPVTDPPSTPTGLTATTFDYKQIDLAWNVNPSTDTYSIFRSDSEFGTYTQIDSTTELTYSDLPLSAETTYYYKITAVNIVGSSGYTDVVYSTTDATPSIPSVPEDFAAEVLSISSIKLTWDFTPAAVDFELFRDDVSLGVIAELFYIDTGLESATTYTYKLRARNTLGYSDFTDSIEATTKSSYPGTNININAVNISCSSSEFLRVNWVIDPTIEDISLYTFQILRSNSPEGKYSTIASVQNKFYYEDWDANLYSNNRIYYYIVRAVDYNSNYKDFGPYNLRMAPDPIALELIRKKNIALSNPSGSGIDISVFIRKTWGTYCKCFDSTLKRKTISNCQLCFGTNYRGGYFEPIASRAFWNLDQKVIKNIGWEFHPDRPNIEMSSYPELSPGDIIKLDDLCESYRVELVRPTSRKTYIISQFVQLSKINVNDIETDL